MEMEVALDAEARGAGVASEHGGEARGGEITHRAKWVKFGKRKPQHNVVVVERGIINANPRQATKALPWSWDMVVSCVKMDFCD